MRTQSRKGRTRIVSTQLTTTSFTSELRHQMSPSPQKRPQLSHTRSYA
ncbi:hypothetical protein CABS01_17110, partial [Colletotrichum abscissum]